MNFAMALYYKQLVKRGFYALHIYKLLRQESRGVTVTQRMTGESMFEIPVPYERITNENDGRKDNYGEIGFFGPRKGADRDQLYSSMRSSELESQKKTFNSGTIITLGQTKELNKGVYSVTPRDYLIQRNSNLVMSPPLPMF